MKKKPITLVIIGIIVVVGLIWLATHSIISVQSTGSESDGEFELILTGGDGVAKTYKSDEPSFKKIVSRGSYTAVVKHNDDNYFRSVKTKPFLITTRIDANPVAETQRSFVGDNPAGCMYWLGPRLISNNCDEVYYTQEHLPATSSLPTYTQHVETNELFGEYKGMVRVKSGENIALFLDVEGYSGYKLQSVRDNLTGGERYKVPASDPEGEYFIEPYRDGVIVYDDEFQEFLYYPDISKKPETITLTRPEDTALSPLSVTVSQDAINVVYGEPSNQDEGVDLNENTNPGEVRKGDTQVLVYRSEVDQKLYSFDNVYYTAAVCGDGRICLTDAAGLSVFDISGNKPDLTFEIAGVTDLEQAGGAVLAITKSSIYNLNTDDGSGFIDYSFGGYQYCGLEPAPRGYLLCIFDDSAEKSALYMDSNRKNTDNIDKQTLSLRRTPGVDGVSTYGNFVYIAPDYGEPIYDAVNKVNIPDPAKVKITNNAISAAITAIGIDQTKYTVINTGTQ